ncbi:MAG: hypothetical protein GY719_23255 [bacterium]|nr:hypothetical protein [bacterium]
MGFSDARREIELLRDLASQDRLSVSANVERLQELEARIQETARRLRPDAPEVAIRAARRELSLDELAVRLLRRTEFPLDAARAPEVVQVQVRHLENRILDLARELQPSDPWLAVAEARPVADRHIEDQRSRFAGPAPHLDEVSQRLDEIAPSLGRLAREPRPDRRERVREVLSDLRRLQLLDIKGRRLVELRQHLVAAGNVYELQARLEKIPEVRAELYESVHEIYRDPGSAIEAFEASIRRQGRRATIERFGGNPGAFGELRGRHLGWLGNTPQRKRALDLVWHNWGFASKALTRREGMNAELAAARRLQRRQSRNRKLQAAFPSRERLLADLGRHMEGLGMDEVRPLLQPGQAKLVGELRQAERRFLEPLRAAAGKFTELDARGLVEPAVRAEAQRVAALFQPDSAGRSWTAAAYAPRHILRRLTPPQMQGALAAVAVARRAVASVARSAAV